MLTIFVNRSLNQQPRYRPDAPLSAGLTVQDLMPVFSAICGDDSVIRHELTVQFLEDGTFRYLSNQILDHGVKRSGDAHEFEAEKCRLSGANSAQGTSKTKIVLSFPINMSESELAIAFRLA